MINIKEIESTTQEITLFVTFVAAISMLFGGYFYLSQDSQILSLTGTYGHLAFSTLFDLLGYSLFYLSVAIFFTGKFIIAKAQQPKDIYQHSYPIVLRITAHLFTMIIISSLLSVAHIYFAFDVPEKLNYGAGGALGSIIGGTSFELFGLMGSLTILLSLALIVSMIVGSFHLVSTYLFVKDIIVTLLAKSQTKIQVIYVATKKQVSHTASLMKEDMAKILPIYELSPLGPDIQNVELAPKQEPLVEKDKKADKDMLQLIRKLDEQVAHLQEQLKDGAPKAVKQDSKPADVLEDDSTEQEEVSAEKKVISISDFKGKYTKPEIRLLAKAPKAKGLSKTEIEKQCKELEERLASFQLNGKIIAAHVGVSLTMFEFQPAAGVKLSKISSLTNDLALVLGASSIRVLAPIPGKTTVGIEVPNKDRAMVSYPDLIEKVQKQKDKALPIAMGLDIYNQPLISDISEMPHLLVSGTTGSGKSVFINTLITSLLFNKSPKDLRFLMVDPKMIELSPYNGIPHLLKPVVTDVEEAKDLLVWAEEEMDRRYQMFADVQARNISSFNEAIKDGSKKTAERRSGKKIEWNWQHMPYIVIVIDELADLMLTQGKEVEIPITRIAQKARAAGIHLVIATQRPSAEIVTGLIKTNFPTRISFKVSSAVDSRTILDTSGAEKLLGKGDMLYMPNGKSLVRLQGAFVSEKEVKSIVKSIRD
tara:strand:+ start:3067 stop:5181 length:2115 start_codon:yes stop_codon:yes gene_type:complete